MVGGTGALPQARGMDGGEPDSEDDEAAEVYVGHRRTKRRKGAHGDKARAGGVLGGSGGGRACARRLRAGWPGGAG